MSTLPNESRLSADDRYELASRAVTHQRQARPVHLVVFGAIVFITAIILLALAWRFSISAQDKLNKNQVTAINVERMIFQINELQAAQAMSTGDDVSAPISDILTRLTTISKQVGLENDLKLPKTSSRDESSTRLLTYEYNIRDSSLEQVLLWIQKSQDQIPGLQVREMTITPNVQSWLVKVTLSRYERIE